MSAAFLKQSIGFVGGEEADAAVVEARDPYAGGRIVSRKETPFAGAVQGRPHQGQDVLGRAHGNLPAERSP